MLSVAIFLELPTKKTGATLSKMQLQKWRILEVLKLCQTLSKILGLPINETVFSTRLYLLNVSNRWYKVSRDVFVWLFTDVKKFVAERLYKVVNNI